MRCSTCSEDGWEIEELSENGECMNCAKDTEIVELRAKLTIINTSHKNLREEVSELTAKLREANSKQDKLRAALSEAIDWIEINTQNNDGDERDKEFTKRLKEA